MFRVLEVGDVARRLFRCQLRSDSCSLGGPRANGLVHVTGTSVNIRGSDLPVIGRNSTKRELLRAKHFLCEVEL